MPTLPKNFCLVLLLNFDFLMLSFASVLKTPENQTNSFAHINHLVITIIVTKDKGLWDGILDCRAFCDSTLPLSFQLFILFLHKRVAIIHRFFFFFFLRSKTKQSKTTPLALLR
jgi:hypothetical protein